MVMKTQDAKKNIFYVIIVPMIGIIGVVVGAIMTDHFDRKRGEEELSNKLMLSAYECDFREASWLLEGKANVNTKSKSGLTPLHRVIKSKKTIRQCYLIAERLIRFGAKVNASSNSGDTPLHFAAEKHLRNMMRLLVCNRAQINATNKEMQTPLLLAIINTERTIERKENRDSAIKMLVRAGANLELTDKNGRTPKAIYDNDEKWEEFLERRLETNEYIERRCSNYRGLN